MARITLYFLPVITLISACTAAGNYQQYLSRKNLYNQSPSHFIHCHGYGCTKRTAINLTAKDWQDISTIFTPKALTPEEERTQIAEAVGLLEQKTGELTGTDKDIHGTFIKTGEGQLDCVDESTNTTTYLALLKKRNLLHFHTINAPTSRVPIIHAGRWPHQTAVIVETATNTPYAVDSWFHDNGVPAEIVPLTIWKKGWKPDQNL